VALECFCKKDVLTPEYTLQGPLLYISLVRTCLVFLCQVLGSSLEGYWQVLGRSLAGPWQVLGRSLAGPWQVLGRSLAGPWQVLGRSLAFSVVDLLLCFSLRIPRF
jgi:hypothetical protein